jgi:hypothetical protein
VTADVNLRHTVYIFAEQSANNTWNRVLRFSPGTEIRAGALASKLQGEVVANYTVYDFESAGSPQKSYSLRQLTLADSTSIPLSRRLSLTALLQYRRSERGTLAWTAFTVRPMLLYDERSVLLALTHEGAAVTVSAGFRLFLQQRYRRSQAAWREESTMESLGPVVHLVVGAAPGMRTVLDGWYQRTRVTGGDTVTTPELSIGVLWNP